MEDKIHEIITDLLREDLTKQDAIDMLVVSGSLPMYDVEELNEIVTKLNSGEIDLYDCIGRVWNKAYFIGANEGMKAGQLGNYR
jgi:ABC-type molybdate transport system ATPase subunit